MSHVPLLSLRADNVRECLDLPDKSIHAVFSPNPLQSLKRAAPLGAEGVQTAAGPQQKRARGAVVDIGTRSIFPLA